MDIHAILYKKKGSMGGQKYDDNREDELYQR